VLDNSRIFVALLAHHNEVDLDETIKKVLRLIQERFEIIKRAEASLPIPSGDAKLDADILRYIQGCHDVIIGTVYWA
jgi:hypothetical protein